VAVVATALKNDAKAPILSPYAIVELAAERKKVFAERDVLYETFQKYYRGKQAVAGPSVQAANAQGRPLLRLSETKSEADRAFSTQRLAPIIDDSQALLGRMPASRVEPPDNSEAGVATGELLSKYLISTHDLSRMDRQQAEMGYHLPCLGDGCYTLEVDPDLRRVTWTVVDPSTAYPSFMWGYRRFDVMDLVICYYLDPYVVKARWGIKADQEKTPVCVYLSKRQRTVVVGDREPEQVAHVEWDLRFCPAVWVFNKVNGQFANSDIAQSLIQQDALDFMWAVMLDGVVHNTYPIIGIRRPLQVSSDPITIGPGAPPVLLGEGGGIEVTRSQGDLSAIQYGMDQLVNDIYAATGTTQVRQQGTMHSAIVTGRAMHAAQGPQATRVELKQQELGLAIRTVNAMTLEMQEKAPLLGDHEFEIFGRYRGASFRQLMSGKDIDGNYRNTVSWEPVTGMNLQQKTAIAYEGGVAGLWDDLRARELVGEEDPMGMRERIAAQKLHEAQLQAQIQTVLLSAQQPGGGGGGAAPGGPPGVPPPAGGPMPTGGGGPSSQPAPMLMRPRGLGEMQAPPAGGVPQGISRQMVENALMLIAERLRGTVAVTGEMATQGEGTSIVALISNPKDYDRVLPVLRALDPNAKVTAMPENKWPAEAVRVA
jgi:hypothetical protein